MCSKKVKAPNKGIYCKSCDSLVHKKCSSLSTTDIIQLKKRRNHYECPCCAKNKFPFTDLQDNEISEMMFNSNFICQCLKRSPYKVEKGKYKFNITNSEPLNNKCFNSESDKIDAVISDNLTSPDFNYYENHDFHKLINKNDFTQNFSLLHTNICSLQGNFEKLENMIANLGHKFSVIALSETWSPESTKHTFQAGQLDHYQPYFGINGKTLKSGCGFYIHSKINFIPRTDLDRNYCDENNEFQCKWIEIINPKKTNIVIGVYYRHPKKTSTDKFNEMLNETLLSLKKSNKLCIISGDFNYNLLNHERHEATNNFISNLFSSSFIPVILEPTRVVSKNKPSLIDNIFINFSDKKNTSGNLIEKISDHMPNFIIYEELKLVHNKKKEKYK